MDGRNNKGPPDLKKSTIDSSLPTTNKSVPRGLLFRELGCKRKQNSVSPEFQIAAEDRLVVKSHAELPCELPDVSRSTFLMVFSPDGTKVASTHGNHNVYVTDLNSGKNVNTLSGHPRTPWCIAFHPSSNQILASGCLGGQVRVWDLHGGSEIWTAESQTVIASLAFHPTDRMLVIATYNELHFWDWSQPVPFTKCYTSNEKEKVRYVAFDPLGHKLITGISNAPHNQTQWDRVATPSHRGSSFASLSRSGTRNTSTSIPPEERRIAVCYRSLVEQYEQLVQRYYDLSRSRTTPTMDRGTDPMDLSESSVSGSTSTTHLPATDNNSRMSVHQENSSSNSGNDSSSVNASDNSNSNISPTSSNNANRSTSSADNARPRSRDRLRHIPSVVLMHSLIRRFDRQSELLGRQRSEDSHGQEETSIPPVATQRPQSVRSGSAVLEEGDNARDTSAREPSRSEQQGLFPQNQSAPCQPERPRRFFISQRSAFQPRIPRGSSEETHSEPHTTGAQTPNSIPNTRHFILRHPPYNTSALHNDESTRSEQQNLDSTADVGVRYGIQLLSRHIDNMQRLCRARLEILQLQQIRRMWEDLQRQIRSLHVAVRESTFALSDNIDPPSSRGRRRRLYSHPNEEPALGHSNWRSDPETGITEQGVSHIPSVSQMLEHTRISDSNNSQTPGPARDSSTSSEQPVNSRESLYAEKKGTLARLQAQFAALTKLRLSVEKKSNSNKDGENSRTSIGSSSSHGDVCISRLQPPEPSISQTTDPVISQREPVAGTSAQSSDAATEIPSFAELPEKTEESTDEVDRPIKKKREELMSNSEMKESSPVSSGSSSFTSYESSTSSSIPTILTTTVPTITTITSNCSGSRERPEAGHRALYSQLGGNWSRYPTPNVSAIANSPNPPSPHQQRLWRISRRVYLRRPRLLALGPRTRSMARQMNSGSATHRSYSSSIFRQQEYGRRPWFLQSTHRNQLSRTSERGISTGAQVDPQGSEASAPEASEDNVIVSSQSASPLSSDTSLIVTTPSDQSSSPSKGTCYQSTSKSCPSMSSQIEEQPGPSGCQEEPHGVKRKADTHSTAACPGTSKDRDSGSSQTHRGQTTSQSLRSMISRLESLVRQQREQREAAERLQERSHPHGASFWDACLPDGITSGSDSDSNPETDRHQSWNEANSNERLISSSQRGRSGQLEEDWEWTRESTRLRARQVLSLMVESLTQFFEDNGLSNSSSHAVLDEQIYNLYILLQLALELTDLLLAQLVSTRRELEHQWVHRLRSPVALDEGRTTTRDRPHPPRRRGRYPSQERGSMGPANVLVQSLRRRSPSPFDVRRGFVDEHHSRSRLRILDGSRGSHRPRSRPVNPADYNRSSRMGPAYRRLLRFRNHHPVMEAFMAQFLQTSNSGTTSSNTPSTPSTPISPSAATEVIQGMRRLGPRVVSGYARHFSNSLNPGGPRRDNTLGVPPYIRNTPELIRNSTSDIPPYIQNTPEARDTTLGVPPYIQNTPEVRVNTLGIPPYIRMTPEIRDNTLGIPPYIRNTPEVRDNTLDTPPYIRNSSEIRDNTLGITPSLEIRDNTLGIPPYIRGSSENRFRGEGNTTVPSSPRAPHIMVRVQVPGSSVSADQPSSQDHHQPPSSQQQQDTFTVPLVRVNDVLIPDTSILSQPQPIHRPQSPPPQYPSPNIRNPFIQHPPPQQMSQQLPSPYRYLGTHSGSPGEPSWRNWRPRFLHPRYMAPNPFNEDEEPSVAPVFENINFIRGNTRDSFIIADAPMSPNHRIQAWDFSRLTIPDISNAEKNVIVGECKIHNDASVDVSNDGRLLVTLLPTGRLSSTAMLGVYSLEWESLGQCLYTTSFEQNAVSVSLSPTSRHLLVGLASRRVALLPSDRLTMAQIFRLEGGVPGRTVGARGRLCHVRDVEQDREQGYMSLNCIRWAPRPGQGLVYGTNTGKLRVLR